VEKIYPLSVNSVVEVCQIRSSSTTSVTETLAQCDRAVEFLVHNASYLLGLETFPKLFPGMADKPCLVPLTPVSQTPPQEPRLPNAFFYPDSLFTDP
jgi:hypothetical protein